ncbi:transcription-repair coupling factor [bacterium]|nr:transcription-repair coupling factor [bacterium]
MVFKSLSALLNQLQHRQLDEAHIVGLWGSARAFLADYVLRQWMGPVVFIASSSNEAERFLSDLHFFSVENRPDPIDMGEKDDGALPGARWNSDPGQAELSEPVLRYPEEHVYYPPWELLPLENMSPYNAVCHRRIISQIALARQKPRSVTVTPDALMKKNIPRALLEQNSVKLELFQEFDRDRLVDTLHNLGYVQDDIVESAGQYAVRGGVLDIAIPLYNHPVRIEFIGDQIESLREFEIESQRSLSQLLSIEIVPAREVIYSSQAINMAIERINQSRAGNKIQQQAFKELIDTFEQRLYFEGIEWYQPFFFEQLESFLAPFPAETLIVILDRASIKRKINDFDTLIQGQFRHFRPQSFPYFPLEAFYQSSEQMQNELQRFPRLYFSLFSDELSGENVLEVHPQSIPTFQSNLERAFAFLEKYLNDGYDITLFSRTTVEQGLIQRGLDDFYLSAREQGDAPAPSGTLSIRKGSLSQGFIFTELKLVLVSAFELFQEKSKQVQSARYRGDELIASFRDLKIGDYVVHVDNGIGRYQGTQEITVENVTRDFLILVYAGDDKLFLPMDRINLIQRYSTAENAVQIALDKLGSTRWSRLKVKISKSIREMALELIELYAAREVLPGFRFPADDHWQNEFEATFPFEETPDQLRAIEQVKNDMEQDVPMDRLICGDVGYGKTEVAMRAAFKAVMSGFQVAVLAPTTILAQQHYLNFAERFEPFPVRLEVLSRFRTSAEQKQILQDVGQGKVDIIVGTHRLLQKDIEFKNLGLIVVDEEQRFGVSHKEKLKKLRKKADVLTLTATPIPRTLHMAIAGLRDMSIINTPPENRLAIHTKVLKFNADVIKEAIVREIQRGGQVYFVHNRVKSIYSAAHFLQTLLPDVTFGVAHGQMKENELKKIMNQFMAKKFDVLVSTTIIESGIDIPSVNTMIINRADKLGLAQMYQLRGRVGRAHHRAFCYMLTIDFSLLSKVALQRLKVIRELTELGSGFRIAAHDLEIRGAGNLLGAQQHGHISAIGFDMYCSLLEKAVKELRGEKQKPEVITSVTLPFEAYIPQTFIPDTNQRLMIYRTLTSINNQLELDEYQEELRDRFGAMPVVVQRIFTQRAFTLQCNSIGIERLEIAKETCFISFAHFIDYSPKTLVQLCTEHEAQISFPSSHAVKIKFPDVPDNQVFLLMQQIIRNMKNIADSDTVMDGE